MKTRELKNRTLLRKSTRKGILLIIVAAITLEAISLIQSYFANKGITEEAQMRAESQLTATQNRIKDIINQAEAAVRNNVWIAQWSLNVPDSMARITQRLVEDNPVVSGSTIALVPGYLKSRPLFAPYTAKTSNGQITKSLATEAYNYQAQEWFTKPIEVNEGYWSEPYLDEGGGEILMSTYSMPIKDEKGKTAAVLTADLDLQWLKELIESIQIYPNAFSTMISRSGKIMVGPEEDLVMTMTVNEYAASSSKDSSALNSLNRAMLAGERGSMPLIRNGEKLHVYYAPIDKTGWSMNIIIPDSEIYGDIKRVNLIVKTLQILGLMLIILILRSVVFNHFKYKAVSDRKEMMEKELKIASDIQMSMIPKTFPPFPERVDIDLSATLIPAKEVSGDLYDFFIRDEKLFFCIGDVSGKGVPASLLMAVTRSLFRSVCAHQENPKEIVSTMNNSMSDMNESNMFVTFICCVLDLKTGKMQYCNAGHNAPLIFTDRISELPVNPNLPLGVIRDMEYTLQEVDLHYDDAIFLYTDGITEAENPTHGLFGLQRLKETLSGRKPAQAHLDNVKQAVANFVKDAPQSDDLTMLFFHYLNYPTQGIITESITLSNDIREIVNLEKFIGKIAENKKISDSQKSSINLAMEEAVSNAIMYSGSDKIEITALASADEITFTVTDHGKPFDPTALPEMDVSQDAEDRPIGGLGIHLYRKIMDKVTYMRKDEKNILTLTKKIG